MNPIIDRLRSPWPEKTSVHRPTSNYTARSRKGAIQMPIAPSILTVAGTLHRHFPASTAL